MRPADTAASKTKQAFAVRFPIAVRTCVPYVPFLPLRNAHFASRSLLSCCFACPLWAYAHERRPFFSRSQTLFIVSANLFSRDEKTSVAQRCRCVWLCCAALGECLQLCFRKGVDGAGGRRSAIKNLLEGSRADRVSSRLMGRQQSAVGGG